MTQAIELIKRNARVAVLAVVIVVLVVVAFIFYLGSQSSADQQAKLETQVKVAKITLSNAQGQYDLTTLQAEQNSLTNSLSFLGTGTFPPVTFPNVELSAYISAAADRYGVDLVSMSPRGATGTDMVGGQQYVRNETNVNVTGNYASMDSFLNYLEQGQQGPFPSLSLENASFSPTGGSFTVVILTQS
jgi:Tfp pilus assembly protein PilO